ncbi:MAG: hypothetical protein WC781_02060 [Candidatus Pacearchaeota archaeon]|jgi:ribosome-binding protein aMBF1 (putative translation factor)
MDEAFEKCYICNEPKELIDAIGSEEVIKVCKDCAERNHFPIIHKATPEELQKARRFYGVHERLSSNRPDLKPIKKERTEEDKELERFVKEHVKKGEYPELVDNFHWHIQHARRLKKISQKQLAENIAEQEIMIEMAEQGKLPEDYNKLITKLEQYLKVQLKKQPDKLVEVNEDTGESSPEEFEIKKANLYHVTTGYLKSLKEKWNKWGEKNPEENSEEPKEGDEVKV